MLDEPTSSLDLAHMHSVASAPHLLAADDRVVIVATHDTELIGAAADALVRLDGGRITPRRPNS